MQNMLIWISDLGHGPLYFLIALSLMLGGWLSSDRSQKQLNQYFWLGWRLTIFWLIGILLNTALKYYFIHPRPWWVDPNISPLHPRPAGGFGMPSGHTQSAMGMLILGYWLGQFRAKLGKTLSIRFSLFIGVALSWIGLIAWSRIYLHAHSLAQVATGATVGLVWIFALSWLEKQDKVAELLVCLIVLLSMGCFWQIFNPITNLPQEYLVRLTEYQVTVPLKPSSIMVVTVGLTSLFWVFMLRIYRKNEES